VCGLIREIVKKYGNTAHVNIYPHTFRHSFAINIVDKVKYNRRFIKRSRDAMHVQTDEGIAMDRRKPCLWDRQVCGHGREGDRLCTQEKDGKYLFTTVG